MIRLNLGAGNQPYTGYTGIDLGGYACDVVHDLTEPLPYPDGSVDEIFASHVIEHFPLWQIPALLRDWHRVLKPKTGLFWGFVPDGEQVAREYLRAIRRGDHYMKKVMIANFNGGFTNNEHTGSGQTHYAVYDAGLLQETISGAGFHPVFVTPEKAGPLDFRLRFTAGKGIYPPMDIRGVGYVAAVWQEGPKPWEEGN